MCTNKALAIVISMITSLIVGIFLLFIFNKFDLDTFIPLQEAISSGNRYYNNETDSFLTFLGYWHLVITALSGWTAYCTLQHNLNKSRKLMLSYLFTSSTVILIPAFFIEKALDSTINSNSIFNFFDFLLLLSVIFAFFLFWRSYQNKKSQMAGFKLWVLLTQFNNFKQRYIIEARSEEEAKNSINSLYFDKEKIISLSLFEGQLKILEFRQSKPGIIRSLCSLF